MPDTFTHFVIPQLFEKSYRKYLFPSMLLLGAILPDYLRELITQTGGAYYYAVGFFTHSLAGIALISISISVFFVVEQRKRVFLSLFFGQLIHLILDSLQGHLNGGRMYWLLPYWKSFEINLISEEYWLIIFVCSAILYMGYLTLYWFKRKGKENGNY